MTHHRRPSYPHRGCGPVVDSSCASAVPSSSNANAPLCHLMRLQQPPYMWYRHSRAVCSAEICPRRDDFLRLLAPLRFNDVTLRLEARASSALRFALSTLCQHSSNQRSSDFSTRNTRAIFGTEGLPGVVVTTSHTGVKYRGWPGGTTGRCPSSSGGSAGFKRTRSLGTKHVRRRAGTWDCESSRCTRTVCLVGAP